MYHYLFTNDLRISNLESFLVEAGRCFTEDNVPSASDDKNANNNMNTLGFYFNLTKDSNCAKYCAKGDIRPVILNFIKKFQFPNPRTTESLKDSIEDNIYLAPLRTIIQVLYFMNNIDKNEAHLSDQEIAHYIFFNDNIAKNVNPDILLLAKDIIVGRKNKNTLISLDDEELNSNNFYWKQCKRQLREMIKILTWAGCAIKDGNGNIKLYNDNLSIENKAELFDILSYSSYWIPDKNKSTNENKKSYQEYMDISNSENIESKGEFELPMRVNGAYNKIFYGVPGTGKSYAIDQELKNVSKDNKFRITFHPEFTYNDFVGQLLPTVDKENNSITYDFQPGQFTLALKRAYENPTEKIYLIIEEMSRGNCASIFGDIFQLLDREKQGENKDWSRYSIKNNVIASIIPMLKDNEIKIPSNMYILGTINTSDQNVFAMDNAFKRRFEWEYISINPVKDEEGSTLNNIKIKIIEENGEFEIYWEKFYMILNDFISSKKYLDLGEDKQIGQFFIEFDNDEINNKEKIKNKLLHYLWFDVQDASFKSEINLFDDNITNFSKLYDNFKKDQKIFSDEIIENFKRNRIIEEN